MYEKARFNVFWIFLQYSASPKERLALLLENIQDKYRLYESVELTFSLTSNSILYNITFYEFNLLGGLSNRKVLNLES